MNTDETTHYGRIRQDGRNYRLELFGLPREAEHKKVSLLQLLDMGTIIMTTTPAADLRQQWARIENGSVDFPLDPTGYRLEVFVEQMRIGVDCAIQWIASYTPNRGLIVIVDVSNLILITHRDAA